MHVVMGEPVVIHIVMGLSMLLILLLGDPEFRASNQTSRKTRSTCCLCCYPIRWLKKLHHPFKPSDLPPLHLFASRSHNHFFVEIYGPASKQLVIQQRLAEGSSDNGLLGSCLGNNIELQEVTISCIFLKYNITTIKDLAFLYSNSIFV